MTPPDLGLVLLVDDEPQLEELLALALASEGYRVRSASSGVGGLALAWSGETPRAVVLDSGLPDLDPVEFAERLRADPRTGHVPVVLLTGPGGAPEPGLPQLARPFRPSALVSLLRALA